MDDVLVIGAGPAGSRFAGMMAKEGYSVRVLEEHNRAGDGVCCTGIIGRECLNMVASEVKVLRPARSAVFVSPSGKTIRLEKDSPQAYVLDRAQLDRSMAEQAESDGAEFVFGCHVETAVTVNGHVEVHALRNGTSAVFWARVIALASGFSPGLSERLGFDSAGDFAVGAQAEVEIQGDYEVEVRFSRRLAPGFFTWLVPTTGNRALVGLICRRQSGRYLRVFLSQMEKEEKIRPGEPRITYGRIPLKPVQRSYADRMIAVGDAAGQVKPTTGGGIYYGFLCADIAAEVVGRALQADDLSRRRLAEYDRTWKKALQNEIRLGYLSRLVFERLSDSSIDELFDVVQAHALDKMALNLDGFSFDWHGGILSKALSHPGVRGVLGVALKGLLSGKAEVALA